MALRDEIVGYTDLEGFVAPNSVNPDTVRGSDNGVCYTSEYYVILKKSGQLTEQDKIDYNNKISANIDENGLLNRHHVGPDNGQTGPDDYYGCLNACMHLGNTQIPRKFLKAVFKYFGFLNNQIPGLKTESSFLIRQPQLLLAMIVAAFPSFSNPLHFIIRLLVLPLFLIAAMIIFTSCINAPTSDTDARRLSWHLLQTLKPVSLMCGLASIFWYKRLYNKYGVLGMRGVANLYYHPTGIHPFCKYWVD